MKAYLKALCFLLLLSTYACRKVQPLPVNVVTGHTEPKWKSYTTTNSPLPNMQINALAISKQDVKWIGTANGLARLEGTTWTVFTTSNSGLPSNTIHSLAIQDNGTVWVGTNQGLARFDGTRWRAFTTANSELPASLVMSIAYDPVYDRAWAGTERGVVSIDASGTLEAFTETEGNLPLSMVTDADGALWIGAHEHFSFRGNIRKFASGKWKTYWLPPLGYNSAFPYAIGITSDHSVVALLAGTSLRTAIKFTGGAWQEMAYPEKAYGVRAMAIRGNDIWVSGTGLSKFGSIDFPVLEFPGISSTALSLAIDAGNNKWIGTTQGGVLVYRHTE